MEEVENRMVVEARQQMLDEATNPVHEEEETYEEVMEDVCSFPVVKEFLNACGFEDLDDCANWVRQCADLEGLKDLRDDLEENQEVEPMNQCSKIMRYLEDFGSITPLEAMEEFGIMRLAARILELRAHGVKISSTTEYATNRYGENVHYTRYILEKQD